MCACVLVRLRMCVCVCASVHVCVHVHVRVYVMCVILVTQGITARVLRNDDCIGWVASYVVSKRCDDMVKMRLRASRAPCAKQHLRDLPIRYRASPETNLTFRSARATCAQGPAQSGVGKSRKCERSQCPPMTYTLPSTNTAANPSLALKLALVRAERRRSALDAARPTTNRARWSGISVARPWGAASSRAPWGRDRRRRGRRAGSRASPTQSRSPPKKKSASLRRPWFCPCPRHLEAARQHRGHRPFLAARRCVRVCVRVRLCACARRCVRVRACVRVCVHVHVHVHVCVCVAGTSSLESWASPMSPRPPGPGPLASEPQTVWLTSQTVALAPSGSPAVRQAHAHAHSIHATRTRTRNTHTHTHMRAHAHTHAHTHVTDARASTHRKNSHMPGRSAGEPPAAAPGMACSGSAMTSSSPSCSGPRSSESPTVGLTPPTVALAPSPMSSSEPPPP